MFEIIKESYALIFSLPWWMQGLIYTSSCLLVAFIFGFVLSKDLEQTYKNAEASTTVAKNIYFYESKHFVYKKLKKDTWLILRKTLPK